MNQRGRGYANWNEWIIQMISNDFKWAGDEILSVNDESLVGLSHAEAIAVFKRIKSGDVVISVVRRLSTANNNKYAPPTTPPTTLPYLFIYLQKFNSNSICYQQPYHN